MISEDSETTSGKDEDHLVPAFGVSGQFMMTSEEKAVHTEDFNPRKIVALTLDDSLARLFECLTLEYSGSILLTPKWKNFRSQKLKFAEKTRINNAIWRSWHIQFQLGKRPLFCQFDNPLTEMAKPPKPMTLMIEGRYWKRKLEVVAAEYQKWRVFYKQMVEDKFQDIELRHQTEEILRLDQEISDNLRERERERNSNIGDVGNQSFSDTKSPLSLVVSQALEMVDSCNLMESMVFSLPDTLFTSLGGDSRRIVELSPGTFKDTADTVQPTLDTLQPSLEAMTPVLDDLIEQLEASMKGSDFTWDFGPIDKNMELPFAFNQPGQAQLETMDHSGRYNEPYRPTGSLPSSMIMTSTWPVQTRTIQSQPIFPGNLVSGREAVTPVWSSSPEIQPGVMGIQTVGTAMPGLFSQANATRQNAFTANPSSVVYTAASSVMSSSTGTTSRPYMPTSMATFQSAASAGLRHTSTAGSIAGRIPRNSSDSQLYALAVSDSSGHISSSPLRPRAQSTVPVEVQAPNLVAQLKLTKPRHSLVEEKAKRPRIPRNKSAPGLANLEASAQLKKTPQAGGVRAKRLGRLPRNRSDSSLASLLRQSEQSASRHRPESESSSLFMVGSPTSSSTATQPYARQDQPPHVFTEHRLVRPDNVETMQEDVMQLASSASTSGVSSSSSLPPVPGGDGGASSQLVNQMVTHLMSKGVSVEEILNKLTTLVGAAVPASSLIAQQAKSLGNTVPSTVQDPLATQRAPFTKGQFSSYYPNTDRRVNSPPALDTPTESPRITPARSRRKPQTPRPSLKNMRSESTAVTEASGLRSTDDIIQNILSQNRQEFQAEVGTPTTIQVAAIDPSNIRESTTLGSVNRWSNTDNASFFGHNPSLGDCTSPRTPSTPLQVPSQPLPVQNPSAHVAFPAVFQGSPGEVILQEGSTVDKQFPGLRSSGISNSGFTPSMLISTPPAMTMTVAQVSPPSRTVETSKSEVPAPSVFCGNYKVETDTQVRSRPLTKTLPKDQYMEHRRMVHVSAEQKRRGNIKMGFDQLIAMVPALASQGNNKISKAAVLRKSVDYILQIQREGENMKEEHDKLRKEIENLNSEISVCQQQLPATGVMVNNQDYNEMESLFNHYVKQRTAQNPKFWIFSVIMRPLFDAYNSTVTTGNAEDFCRTVLSWLNQNCTLPKLRPSVLASLRELSKNTSILTDPSKLPEQARMAANSLNRQSSAEGRPR